MRETTVVKENVDLLEIILETAPLLPNGFPDNSV